MKNLSKYLLIVLLSLACSTNAPAQIFRGINCSSPDPFTSPQGDFYAADREYTVSNGYGYQGGGPASLLPNRFTGGVCDLDSLYFLWRIGDFSYLFDLPAGTYAVTLYCCEKDYNWYDFRKFSVVAEGDSVVFDLDVFKRTGRGYSWPVRFPVELTDGQLNVNLVPSLAEAALSGISVRSISPDTTAPYQLQNFEIINGYEMNILYWDWSEATDLYGYRVYRREAGQPWEPVNSEIVPQYRYLDYDVLPGVEYEYKLTAVDHWGNESIPTDSLSATPLPQEDTQLTRYTMEITEENQYLLNINIWSDEYVDVDLILEDEYYPGSGVRYRGSTYRTINKKNYKLRLPTGETHNLRRRFNLQSGMADSSLILERLGYQSYDFLGILNPFSQSVHLERRIIPDGNDEFIGVYLDIEQVDNYFLERNGLSPSGNLYKALLPLILLNPPELYQEFYIKENNPNSGWDDIIDFIEWLNTSTHEEFLQEAGSRFAVDDYLDMYLVNITNSDRDFVDNNFYMYINPVDHLWYFIPWDHNEVFKEYRDPINMGTMAEPLYGAYNTVVERLLSQPLFRYAYCKKLERYLTSDFSIPTALAWVDSIHNEVQFDALRDVYKYGWERPDAFLLGVEALFGFIELRVPFLLDQIHGYITNPELAPYFRLNELQTDNQNTITDEAGDYDPWIEIHNLTPVELDMEDFVLYHGGGSWVLPAEAVVDAYGFILIWMDGEEGEGPLHSSIALSSSPGALLLEGRQGATADSVIFPALGSDQAWAREFDGAGEWNINPEPTPGSTNTPLPDPSLLLINEFLALNDNFNPDPAGEFDDWAEIYNPTEDTIPVGGIYFTDNFSRPMKWSFPDTFIGPESYLLVWCDEDHEQGFMHAGFKLSGNGEQIGLFDRDGSTPIDTLTFTEQESDISYGRYPNGGAQWTQLYPTPEAANQLLMIQSNDKTLIPNDYSLEANYPNPFNPTTIVRFSLPKPSHVNLQMYDILGRQVASLVDGMLETGVYSVSFDGSEFASGIYFYRLNAGDFTCTRKMLLLR